jgi:hypothetical protein
VEVQIRVSLTSALHRREWSASRPTALLPRKKTLVPTREEAGWALQPVWTLWMGLFTLGHRCRSLVETHSFELERSHRDTAVPGPATVTRQCLALVTCDGQGHCVQGSHHSRYICFNWSVHTGTLVTDTALQNCQQGAVICSLDVHSSTVTHSLF